MSRARRLRDIPRPGFSEIALPHTVAALSWGDWDNTTWEKVWIVSQAPSQPVNAVGRVFVDFDGVISASARAPSGRKSASPRWRL